MSEYKSSYMPIEGDVARQTREGASGSPDTGYQIDSHYVNWNSETGVTGKGWTTLIGARNSPFSNMTENDILQEIQNSPDGNLNRIFAELANLTNRQQDEFIEDLVKAYGYTEENGCIGDQLY